MELTRRKFGLLACAAVVSGCQPFRYGIDPMPTNSIMRPSISVDPQITTSEQMYAAKHDNGFLIEAVPYKELDQRFRRQRIPNPFSYPVGSVVVDPRNHHAYFVESQSEVVRYGVGVGRAGFEWSGAATVGRKAAWPIWTPPAEMIDREPELAKYAGGMPPGLKNPLGARALYLFSNNRDTLYRLHGSPEWWTIGQSMSSGCVRFINQDIIDLHDRVSIGSPVFVLA